MVPIETPLGTFRAFFAGGGLRRLDFPSAPSARGGRVGGRGDLPDDACGWAGLLSQELTAYLEGRLTRFSVPLDLVGTAFQLQVWHRVLDIPYGARRSYAEVARAVGRPGAARAVGAANRANPVPILVPCHRLVGSSGALTGYGGGLELKGQLLALEAAKGRPG